MEHVDSNGKLNKSCFCRVCGCKILIAGAATYEDSEVCFCNNYAKREHDINFAFFYSSSLYLSRKMEK